MYVNKVFILTGLFHAAISQSGTALSPWAFSFPDRHRKMAAKLADFVHCPAYPSEEFVKCLMDLPAEEIVSVQQYFIVSELQINLSNACFNDTMRAQRLSQVA